MYIFEGVMGGNVFMSLKIVLILLNSADSDEMLHTHWSDCNQQMKQAKTSLICAKLILFFILKITDMQI